MFIMFITLSITSKQAFEKFITSQAKKIKVFEICVQSFTKLLQTHCTIQNPLVMGILGDNATKKYTGCPRDKYTEKSKKDIDTSIFA